MKSIRLIIDDGILDIYYKDYFKKYPRRKKRTIVHAVPMSLNRFIAMKRMQQNSVKQNYKEFSSWLASYYNIANLYLDKATITYIYYFKDHRRRDMDNMMLTPKFFNDGFVQNRVLVDDSGDILEIKFESFHYDRLHPRIEMLIEWEGK